MNKAVYAIVGTVVAIAVVAVAVIYVVLPALNPGPPSEIEMELTMVDYGFEQAGFQPERTIIAGQTVILTVTNEGTHEHEFMIVEDKGMSMMMMNNMIADIQDDPNYTTEAEMIAEYEARHHDMSMAMEDANGVAIEIEVEPGEDGTVTFTIDEPGTYFFVCHNVGGTWPAIHQDEGMWGTLIVEAA